MVRLSSTSPIMAVRITEDTFGYFNDPDDGNKCLVRRFTLVNKNGMKVQVINYGATITSLQVPDSSGKLVDVVLGFEGIDGYLGAKNPYFGATIGRAANRIAKGKFILNGKESKLATNNGPNHLHGGVRGFDKRMWETHVNETNLTFSYSSRDGEEGYPGEVLAQVTIEVTPQDELVLKYQATTTKPTPLCLTNHSYFNLSGAVKASEMLKDHWLQINADDYTPVNNELIPTGEIKSVKDTKFDFREPKDMNEILQSFPPGPNGFDHNFCINQGRGKVMNHIATVQSRESKLEMEVSSDQPGVQFYTANFFPDPDKNEDPLIGKEKAKYWKHGAFCLETQTYPNAVNQPNFPGGVLNPGQIYLHRTVFKFSSLNS